MTKALGKEGSFAEGPSNSPRQRFFLKILKISLPRAREQALGKGFKKKFKKKLFLCRGPALGKKIQKKTTSLPRVGLRQRNRQRRRRVTVSFLYRGPWSLPSTKRQKFNFFFVFCIPSTQAFHIYTYIYHTEPILSQYITTIIVNHKSQYITTSHMFIIIHMFITTS